MIKPASTRVLKESELEEGISQPTIKICIHCETKPVAPGRRKYCNECSEIVKIEHIRENNKKYGGHLKKPDKDKKYEIRICLRCDNPFESEGPWNHRCENCGGTGKRLNVQESEDPEYSGRDLPARFSDYSTGDSQVDSPELRHFMRGLKRYTF